MNPEEITSALDEVMKTGPDLIVTYGTKIVTALLIFFIGKWLAFKISRLLAKGLEKNKVDLTICRFTKNISYYLLVTIVIIAALGQIGIQTASFVAIIGAAGLAIGLALQGSLSNFASGVLLILFRPFKVGDFVDAGGTSGTVHEVSIFSTIFKTPDNKTVIVSNSAIMNGVITNFSAEATRRVDFVVGISYDSDLKLAQSELQKLADNDERVLKEKGVTIGVCALADSSVNINFRVWVETANYWDVFHDLNEAVKLRFDEVGIGIPFPQMDVHVIQEANS